MGKRRKKLEDYSIKELETELARKRLAAREERLQKFQRNGRALPGSHVTPDPVEKNTVESEQEFMEISEEENRPRSRQSFFSRLLWFVEIAAVAGLVYVLFSGMGMLQLLNTETASLGQAPTSTPLIDVVVLPSGHIPPSEEGGARPNDGEIPVHLRGLVDSQAAVQAATPSPDQAHSIYIPALWSSAVPIVQGDGWEQLKKGVGQHIGSADPGQPGNMVLSAHNDIFGEFFRDLDKLKPGDQIYIQTANKEFIYRITGLRIVEPTDVEVMEPTSKASITMISCYPYLIDNQRIVVFAELEQEN